MAKGKLLAVAIITGIVAIGCTVGAVWLGIIGIWPASIPLVALALIFGFMAFKDVQRLLG